MLWDWFSVGLYWQQASSLLTMLHHWESECCLLSSLQNEPSESRFLHSHQRCLPITPSMKALLHACTISNTGFYPLSGSYSSSFHFAWRIPNCHRNFKLGGKRKVFWPSEGRAFSSAAGLIMANLFRDVTLISQHVNKYCRHSTF